MTLDEARASIGAKVLYRTAYGRTDDGVISSVNDRWVLVRYGADTGSKATDPAALSLLAEGVTTP
jgi:hypothetical protein